MTAEMIATVWMSPRHRCHLGVSLCNLWLLSCLVVPAAAIDAATQGVATEDNCKGDAREHKGVSLMQKVFFQSRVNDPSEAGEVAEKRVVGPGKQSDMANHPPQGVNDSALWMGQDLTNSSVWTRTAEVVKEHSIGLSILAVFAVIVAIAVVWYMCKPSQERRLRMRFCLQRWGL